MGAPKQKWTSEEEGALKAGVVKHGTGKWRTILLDPAFSQKLKSRSNVDLKDKWRNISVTALYGSRKKAKLALKKKHKQDGDNSTALTIVALTSGDDAGQQIDPGPPLEVIGEPTLQDFKDLFTSVDTILLDGIASLNSPLGPDVKMLLQYVEEHENMQPDMKRLVTSRLKHLINAGKIVKIKHKYRFSPKYAAERAAAQSSRQLFSEGNKENSPYPEENGVPNLTKPQENGEVVMIKGMTIEEASAAAAKAVVEAEFAMAEAVKAARLANEAEAEAEAAQIIAIVAMKILKCSRKYPNLIAKAT